MSTDIDSTNKNFFSNSNKDKNIKQRSIYYTKDCLE